MASITYTNLFTRFTEKQPVFDFMIKKDEFYINTHGVSISESDKSFTAYNDGLFYILNKNNKPIYFGGINFLNAKLRKERGYPSTDLRVRLNSTTVLDNFVYETYIISFRGRSIGELTISRLAMFQNGNNVLLNPFQSIEFSATYKVLNVNNLGVQYYGKSMISQDRKKGTIDINFTINSFTNKELTQQISENLTMTINVVNTGYVPVAIQQNLPES